MKIHFGLPDTSLGEVALTIGSFDGVHLGHRLVIGRLVERARAGIASALITFEPHPRCVVDPANCPKSITTLEEKLALIEPLGIDHAVVLPFTPRLAELSAVDFMATLAPVMDLRHLVAGRDFAIGHHRQGDIDWLGAYAAEHGFEVEVVDHLPIDGIKLHSTEIRRLVTLGEIENANRLLGREFSLAGRVEPGDRIGRQLGFPTVNLAIEPNKLIPGQGIYAGWAHSSEGVHKAALSIGYRPTFGGTQLRVEGYLLDFQGDLYERHLEIRFVARLRDELKYSTPEALTEQIALDVEETRQILKA